MSKTKIVLPKVAPHATSLEALAARVDKTLAQLTSDLTNFQAPDAAAVGGQTANELVARDLFYQTFETDISTYWSLITGTAGDLSFPTNGKAGGKALQVATEVHVAFPQNIPFDPARRYRIRARIRRQSASGLTAAVGVHTYGADGTTVVDRTGGTDLTVQNNVCLLLASATPTVGDWTDYVGYFQGVAASATSATPSTSPESPRVLHEDARYIRPFLHLNVGGGSTDIEVDFVALEILPERQEVDDLLNEVGGRSKTDVASTVKSGGGVAAGQVDTAAVQNGAITTALLAAGAVVASKIQAGTITATQIAAGTITATQLAADSVTATQILAGTITATEIAAFTITAAEIAAGSITANKLAVTDLAAISAVLGTVYAGIINNLATNPTAGIRLDSGSTKPGTWLNYIDLAATGSGIFMAHQSGLQLNADGTAVWPGAIINSPQLTMVSATYNDTGANVEYVLDWDVNALVDTSYRLEIECYQDGVLQHTVSNVAVNATRPYTVTDVGAGDGVSDSHHCLVILYENATGDVVHQLKTREDISTV